MNAPGTIDSGYRGEVKVCLINLDNFSDIVINRGDKIAQLLIQRVELSNPVEVCSLPDSERANKGFGSTGGHTSL